MSFTVEQKSQLARLMATENLRVEHQKIRTAKFDPINRVLYLPIWQNMSGILYDLLCGHEVGHALYTPAEGWHDAVMDKSKPKAFKHFLNVVEDARIEKKVKRKYPGLKVSFQKAYNELMDRDFFGIKDRDVNGLPFVDRLNLFTKSQYTATWIKFNAEETEILRQVESLETWEDVLKVTGNVWDYSKDEQYEQQLQAYDAMDMDGYGDDEYEFDDSDYDSDYNDEQEDSDNGVKQESDKTSNKAEEQDDAEKASSEGDGNDVENETNDQGDDLGKQVNRFKDSAPSDKDTFIPECQTDEAFRNNEDLLLDEKCKPYVYTDFPKVNYKNIITPAKRVQQLLAEYYFGPSYEDSPIPRVKPEDAKKWVADFKIKNERYIGLLAKEFEMRKAAKAFSKSKLSDTGDIDITKLASYKFDDNIFRKVMLTPKGKNHGLILLLDKSGSMSNNMAGSIEQILVLAMFCRKVNIPFIVYGFGDSMEAHAADLGMDSATYQQKLSRGEFNTFGFEEGHLSFSHVFLREYINSKMSNAEFSTAIRNMIMLKRSFEGRYGFRGIGRPESEHLSNTPLVQAVYACGEIMNQFRKRNNLDLTSLVIVHDGDSDNCSAICKTIENKDIWTGQKKVYQSRVGYNHRNQNVIVRDAAKKFEKKLVDNGQDVLLTATLDWFRHVTGSKIFGFFLTDTTSRSIKGSLYNRYVYQDGTTFDSIYRECKQKATEWVFEEKRNMLVKQFRSDKFLVSSVPGYNAFYLISGGDELKTENEELEIDGKVTAGKLKNAFMKMNKRKAINRVLVSQFIQGIAA